MSDKRIYELARATGRNTSDLLKIFKDDLKLKHVVSPISFVSEEDIKRAQDILGRKEGDATGTPETEEEKDSRPNLSIASESSDEPAQRAPGADVIDIRSRPTSKKESARDARSPDATESTDRAKRRRRPVDLPTEPERARSTPPPGAATKLPFHARDDRHRWRSYIVPVLALAAIALSGFLFYKVASIGSALDLSTRQIARLESSVLAAQDEAARAGALSADNSALIATVEGNLKATRLSAMALKLDERAVALDALSRIAPDTGNAAKMRALASRLRDLSTSLKNAL